MALIAEPTTSAVTVPAVTQQLWTHYADDSRGRLVTDLVERPIRPIRPGEILAEMLFVPMHGSFWLASHPSVLHPRRESFLSAGGFVFGNGGVARVVAVTDPASASIGDVVAIFGHVPCGHSDCEPCAVQHRYTECRYGESQILGHGGGAGDGTYARHVILPPSSYEVASSAAGDADRPNISPLMYAFLAADVRNALTRSSLTLQRKRVLIIGAGLSGRVAAALFLAACPEVRIVVVDSSETRAKALEAWKPASIRACIPPSVDGIVIAMSEHFGSGCDVVFDASSGDTTPLWANTRVLSPGCECVVFGFGHACLRVEPAVLQISGLTIRTSRGVGTIENRREVVALLSSAQGSAIEQLLLDGATRLDGLDEAIKFIRTQQDPPRGLEDIPPAYMAMGQKVTQ